MCTAVHRMDIVGEGKDVFVIAVVILQRHLCDGIPVSRGDMNNIRMQHLMAAGLIHEIHKRRNAAFIPVFFTNFVFRVAQVVEPDHQPRVQKRLLPQPFLQHLKLVFSSFLKNFRIRLEPNQGTVVIRIADHRQIVDRNAAFKPLGIDFAVAGDLDLHPTRQCINDR